ncbi:MAG: pilus assembly protein N-terminal domain-containing protein, partial [Thiotrichales bacterium]|nr:pilus assembly protein N-terminal domain-containing protein [Thiotrichales bacterium]
MKTGKNLLRAALLSFGVLMLGVANAAPNGSYNLMATESIIVKFDAPIKRALIANPDLAILKVLNTKELLVSGKQAGRTELIVWYQSTPSQGHNIVLNISPDASRRDEISKTVRELISQLDPDHTVTFELKNIWIQSDSSVRRELDNLGNQIDDDANLHVKAGDNKDILQQT